MSDRHSARVNIQIEVFGKAWPVDQVGEHSCIMASDIPMPERGPATVIVTVDGKVSRRDVNLNGSRITGERREFAFTRAEPKP